LTRVNSASVCIAEAKATMVTTIPILMSGIRLAMEMKNALASAVKRAQRLRRAHRLGIAAEDLLRGDRDGDEQQADQCGAGSELARKKVSNSAGMFRRQFDGCRSS